MNVQEIVFEDYVICPFCQKRFRTLTGTHLIHKHGFAGLKEFKLEFGIPMGTPLVAGSLRAKMVKHGKSRTKWFKKNVMVKGIEIARECGINKVDMVSKEVRLHAAKLRREKGREWQLKFTEEMEQQGFLDLHKASELLGFSYNYTRKCATDGRLKVVMEKSIRFTRIEWIEDTKKLLKENRKRAEAMWKGLGQRRKKAYEEKRSKNAFEEKTATGE